MTAEGLAPVTLSAPLLVTVELIEPANPLLVAALLPISRSIQIGTQATFFATIINAGEGTAVDCAPSLETELPLSFSFQTSDPLTNTLTGTPNLPVPIGSPLGLQTYVGFIDATGPVEPTDLEFIFDCANADAPAGTLVGINTLLFSASETPVPDLVALAAVPEANGIITIPDADPPVGVFSVAASNVGVAATITVSADTGAVELPLSILICETDEAGQCVSEIAETVTTDVAADATPSFGIFVVGEGTIIPVDPAVNRIFVRFTDEGGAVRGATSVAVRTEQQ